MKSPRRQKAQRYGIAAERLCCWYLRAKGYRIVASRYRNTHGEVDIVARRGNMLVAVEVKARRDFAACAEAVGPQQRARVSRAMSGALAQPATLGLAALREPVIRFDVVWIVPWRLPRHIVDAWRN